MQKVRGARERAREDKKYENEKITNMNEEKRKIKIKRGGQSFRAKSWST